MNGQVFAMSGGTPEHARLTLEVAVALRSLLDPARCRVFASLDAYVLVSSSPRRIECYERGGDGTWTHRVADAGESIHLSCLGGALAVDPLFQHAIT